MEKENIDPAADVFPLGSFRYLSIDASQEIADGFYHGPYESEETR